MAMTILTNRYFLFALRLILGVTFIWASLEKIAYPDQFARIIYYYRIVPGEFINLTAIFLPWLELTTGVMLIVGFWEKSATALIAGMLAVFATALAIALTRGIDIECGCFSTTSKARSPVISLLIRDVLLLIACFIVIRAKASWLSLSGRFQKKTA
ncbi:MAG: DoxX family membrane protein [candidate division Zixibacteria bacterium]|nr:DoxX family membrane protein [candidate division Zixibacteria bacterium]